MGHVVPVNRQTGTADVRACREADAVAEGKLAEFLLPPGALGDALDAFAQSRAAAGAAVHGHAVGLHQLLQAQIDGIDAELLGNFIELDLHREARLRRAMAALRSAGGLVRKNAHPFELISRHFVSNRLQRAGVINRGQTVAAIAAAVEISFILHRLNRAVALHAGFGPHFDRMSAAMDVKRFFPRERDFDWPSGDHRKFGNADLVRKRIAFSAEAAAHRSRDDADAARGEPKNFGQRAMNVMGSQGRRPQRELIVRAVEGHRRVLLHR